MEKVYRNPRNGALATTPWTVEQAQRDGRHRYMDEMGCDWCANNRRIPEMGATTRFVSDDVCFGCHMVSSHARYAKLEGPRNAEQAYAMGETFYYGQPNGEPACFTGSHVAETDLETKRCRICYPPDKARGALAVMAADMDASGAVISKAEAVALNMRVFRTGKACGKGHTACRYVSTGDCFQCVAER